MSTLMLFATLLCSVAFCQRDIVLQSEVRNIDFTDSYRSNYFTYQDQYGT